MSQVVSGLQSGVSAGASSSDGFEAVTSFNQGFLGTGASTLVELSYIAMLLIFGYAAHGTFRYFLPNVRIMATIASTLGLRDE